MKTGPGALKTTLPSQTHTLTISSLNSVSDIFQAISLREKVSRSQFLFGLSFLS